MTIPLFVRSRRRSNRLHAIGTEQSRPGPAAPVVQTEKLGEFIIAEARADADEHVVARDVVEIDERAEDKALCQKGRLSCRFTDEHGPPPLPRATTEQSELFWSEMMQNQCCHDDFRFGQLLVREDVLLHPSDARREIVGTRRKINADELFGPAHAAIEKMVKQRAVARTDLQYAPAGLQQTTQPSRDPAMISHRPVRQTQIASRPNRRRMIGWQMIENLGFEDAFHAK